MRHVARIRAWGGTASMSPDGRPQATGSEQALRYAAENRTALVAEICKLASDPENGEALARMAEIATRAADQGIAPDLAQELIRELERFTQALAAKEQWFVAQRRYGPRAIRLACLMRAAMRTKARTASEVSEAVLEGQELQDYLLAVELEAARGADA